MGDEPYGLKRAKEDIRAARLWKARDRLTGLVATFPADQKILNLLGEVYFQMGDLPDAGRYWYLTDRQGPEVEAAFDALRERHGSRRDLARAIPIRAPLDLYPSAVRDRLGGELLPLLHPRAWDEPPPDLPRGRYVRGAADPLKPRQTKLGGFSQALGGITAAAVLLGGWIFGVVWMSRESNGLVWIPVAIFGLLALAAGWVDARLRRRRFRELQRRVGEGSDAAER